MVQAVARRPLPNGITTRICWAAQGGNNRQKLTIGFAGRYDQIHFKLYAAVDQCGSYHAEDLRELHPTDTELLDAVRWTQTHDPSEGYRQSMKWFLQEFGYGHLVNII
jgi:hypothetical protein